MSWVSWVSTPGVLPRPLAGPVGTELFRGLAVAKDGIDQLAVLAHQARYPSLAPDDGLDGLGKDRGWRRAPGEPTEVYRRRLLFSDYLNSWAGTAFGITEAFRICGMTNVEVYESFTPGWGRNTPAAIGDDTHYRWFNVVIRHPHPLGTDAPRWGEFSWGDGTRWGVLDGDYRYIPLIKELVRKQKSKHAICEWIAVVLAGDIKHTNAADDGDPATPAARVAYLHI